MTKLTAAICGSGNRSRTVWQPLVHGHAGLDLVGVQDISRDGLDKALALGLVAAHQLHLDLAEMLAETRPDVLIVCPVVEAHAFAVEAGLRAGCHVLVEKPFTTGLADAVRLTDLAAALGKVVAVAQSYRARSVAQALREAISTAVIGQVSHIFFRQLRDRELPHLPAYLFDERDPLLNAMGVHHLDLFRYILDAEIVHVEGREFRPSWSRYRHPSGMQLWLETDGGVVISYVATFSSRNAHLPLESLLVEGESGTLFNESEYCEPPLLLSRRGAADMVDLTAAVEARDRASQYALADRATLEDFYRAVVDGAPPMSSARDNVGTIAVLEAARLAFREGAAVNPQELLAMAAGVAHEH